MQPPNGEIISIISVLFAIIEVRTN